MLPVTRVIQLDWSNSPTKQQSQPVQVSLLGASACIAPCSGWWYRHATQSTRQPTPGPAVNVHGFTYPPATQHFLSCCCLLDAG